MEEKQQLIRCGECVWLVWKGSPAAGAWTKASIALICNVLKVTTSHGVTNPLGTTGKVCGRIVTDRIEKAEDEGALRQIYLPL